MFYNKKRRFGGVKSDEKDDLNPSEFEAGKRWEKGGQKESKMGAEIGPKRKKVEKKAVQK